VFSISKTDFLKAIYIEAVENPLDSFNFGREYCNFKYVRILKNRIKQEPN